MIRPLVLSLLLVSNPLTAHADPPRDLASLESEARALVLVQSVLSWYTRTVGEPSIAAETYRGHESLLSPESLATVRAAAKAEKDPSKQRALEFFASYLATEILGQKLAHFDDEVQNAELHASANLPWEKAPVPYKQLAVLAGTEADATRRVAIETASAAVWKQQLNPILERKEAEAQRLAKSLGYPSYVRLAEEARRVDLRALIVESARFFDATDATYRTLLVRVAKEQLGVDAKTLKRSDVARLRKAPHLEKFFPRELMVPSFKHFLAGIGMDLSTVAHTEIRIDDLPHPEKEPRAACYSIVVPSDVRITVKPTGGVDDFVTFFHEGGHALHYANSTTTIWEYQQLGPYALTEGLAETFGHAWDDPAWLRRYRDFVIAWNREHHTSVPVMGEADMAELVRLRVFEELYFLRRYGGAKLIYEAALHGGDARLWAPELKEWKGPAGDLQVLYRFLFARAYGFPLSAEDALRFRTDVDDTLYAADYTRAFGLAQIVHEYLRSKYGDDWYGNKSSGALFRELARDANALQPDEVAQKLGSKSWDLRPTEARLGRLLAGAKP